MKFKGEERIEAFARYVGQSSAYIIDSLNGEGSFEVTERITEGESP